MKEVMRLPKRWWVPEIERAGELYNSQACRDIILDPANALMRIMSSPNLPDSARDVENLASRLDNITVNALDDPYVAFDDAPDISDYYLGVTTDPFADDDLKYLFDVCRIAVGEHGWTTA